jgi:hypothetical protein
MPCLQMILKLLIFQAVLKLLIFQERTWSRQYAHSIKRTEKSKIQRDIVLQNTSFDN